MTLLAERLRNVLMDYRQFTGQRIPKDQLARADAALIAEVEQMEKAVMLSNGLLQVLQPVNDAILSSWVCATNWHEEDGREWLLLDPTPVRLYLAGNQADDKPLFQRAREALVGLFKEAP